MVKTLFTITAVVDGVFGIGLLIAPEPLLSIYDVTTDTAGTFLARFAGGALIGFVLLCWSARGWSDTPERHTLVRVLSVTTTLGFLASLSYQIQPGAPLRAAVFVVLTLAFAIAWGFAAWRSTAR